MADSDKDLKIGISVTANTAGAKQTEAALRGVADASRTTAEAARDSGAAAEEAGRHTEKANESVAKSAKELGEEVHKGAAAGAILREVLGGNILALGHLGAAIKTIGVLLKTNLIGTLFTLGAIAAQVILPIIAGFNDTKKKIEEASKAAEAFNKVKLDELQRQLGVIGEAAEVAKVKFDALQAAKERLNNEEQAALLAELKANTKLTEEQKLKRETEIRAQFRKRADEVALENKQGAVDQAKKKADETKEAALDPQRRAQAAAETFNQLRLKQAAIDDLTDQLKGAREEFVRDGGSDASAAKIAALVKQRSELPKVNPAEMKAAREQLDATGKIADEARGKYYSELGSVEKAQFFLDREKDTQGKSADFAARVRNSEFATALPAAKQVDAEKKQKLLEQQAERGKVDAEEAAVRAEIEDLKSQNMRNLTLGGDPKINASISEKEKQLEEISGRRIAIDNATVKAKQELDANTKALRELNETIKKQSSSPDAAQKSGEAAAPKVATPASSQSEAKPGMMIINGVEMPMVQAGKGGTMTRDGVVTEASSSGSASVEKDGVKYALNRATGKLEQQKQAITEFADAVGDHAASVAKKLDIQQRQIENLQ